MASCSTRPVARPSEQTGPRRKEPRDALGPYTTHPGNFPPTSVIFHNANFVYVRDRYPKSQVHTLLLPRDQSKTRLHPFDAFQDPVFLQSVKIEAAVLKRLVAAELKRMFGDQNGRDWEKEVRVGVHARPSMNHLHVHVMSRDNYSETMKTGKHYNTFNTPFFVGLEEFPLPADDERRLPNSKFARRELICWRCQENFGHKYKELKEHLELEFEEWKKEPTRNTESGQTE